MRQPALLRRLSPAPSLHSVHVRDQRSSRPRAVAVRHLERRPLHALRRADRRRAVPRAHHPRRRDRHRHHRRWLRHRRRRSDARRAIAGHLESRCAWSARSDTTSTRASATGPRASPASPIHPCAGPTATPAICGWRPNGASSAAASIASTASAAQPDRTGYTSEAVWTAMAALRDPPDPHDRRPPPGPPTGSRWISSTAWSASVDARLGDDHPQSARAVAR